MSVEDDPATDVNSAARLSRLTAARVPEQVPAMSLMAWN